MYHLEWHCCKNAALTMQAHNTPRTTTNHQVAVNYDETQQYVPKWQKHQHRWEYSRASPKCPTFCAQKHLWQPNAKKLLETNRHSDSVTESATEYIITKLLMHRQTANFLATITSRLNNWQQLCMHAFLKLNNFSNNRTLNNLVYYWA